MRGTSPIVYIPISSPFIRTLNCFHRTSFPTLQQHRFEATSSFPFSSFSGKTFSILSSGAMDVFIPEDYVRQRRMEKRAAALAAGKKPGNAAEPARGSSSVNKDNSKSRINSASEFIMASSNAACESIVFSCFSA